LIFVCRFTCNKWFGRSIEDGATERVLIAEMIKDASIGDVVIKVRKHRTSSMGRHWSRALEPHKEERIEVQDLQQMLGEVVNEIVRFYYNNYVSQENGPNDDKFGVSLKKNASQFSAKFSSNIKPSSFSAKFSPALSTSASYSHQKNLVSFIFGHKQLLWILNQIFYYGFKNKSRSSFRKQLFIWDYLLQVACELKLAKATKDENIASFIEMIESIASKVGNWGKDSKFLLFLTLSIRDHYLTSFLKLLSKPQLASQFYESESFLRDPILMTFLLQILATFNEMKLTLDPSLTKGL